MAQIDDIKIVSLALAPATKYPMASTSRGTFHNFQPLDLARVPYLYNFFDRIEGKQIES